MIFRLWGESEFVFMYVRQNPDLGRDAIAKVVSAAFDQFADKAEDDLAAVGSDPTGSPLNEPINVASRLRGIALVAQSAQDRCALDATIPAGRALGQRALGRPTTFDEREDRRLARAVLEGLQQSAEVAAQTFDKIGQTRPASPLKIDGAELDVSAETIASLGTLREGDNVGDLLDLANAAPAVPFPNETNGQPTAIGAFPANAPPECSTSPAALLTPQAPWALKRADWLFSVVWADFAEFHVEGRKWKPDEARAARSTLKLVIGLLGDRKLSEYDSDDMRGFRKLVFQLPAKYAQAQPWRDIYKKDGPLAVIEAAREVEVERVSDKTWNKHHSRTSPFFDYARSQNGNALPPTAPNPMDGLFIQLEPDQRSPAQVSGDWRLYNVDELVTFFTAPKLLGCKSSSRWKDAGDLVFRDARYWLLLIAFLHGNRREEPAILKVKHIKRCPETQLWYFNWADPALRHLLKDIGSPRDVPLHWKLLTLGFIEARVAGRDPEDPLFPDADSDAEILRRAGPFGQWFREFRLHCGIDDNDVDFHASRHTVIMQLKKRFTDHLIEAVCGHESKERRSALAAYTHPELLMELKPVVDAIDMPIDVGLLRAAIARSDAIDPTAAWPDLSAPRKWARKQK